MGTKLSNNEIQKQLSKEELKRIKIERDKQSTKIVKK